MDASTADPSVLTDHHVEILKWVLLHRAELNPLALNRLVESLRGDDNRLVLDGRVVDGWPFKIQVTLQFMVELTLADTRVREWRVRWPQQQMALFDALYYVSDRWRRQSGEDEVLDMGPRGRDVFVQHLQRRANVREAKSLDSRAPGQPLPNDERPGWTDQQIDFLYELAGRIAEGVAGAKSGHDLLKQRWTDTGLLWTPALQGVHEVLLLEDPGKSSALLRRVDDRRWRWQYDPAGQRIIRAEARVEAIAPTNDPMLREWVTRIATIDALLTPVLVGSPPSAAAAASPAEPAHGSAETSRSLAAMQAGIDGRPFERLMSWKLLPSSPSWAQVRLALRALAEPGVDAGSPLTYENRSLVAQFEGFLRQDVFLRAVDGLVLAAAALGAIVHPANNARHVATAVAAGARLLSDGCGFGRTDLAGVEAQLGLMLANLRQRLPELPAIAEPADIEAGGQARLLARADAAMRHAIAIASASFWSTVEPEAWSNAMARVSTTQGPLGVAQVSADELLCATAGRGPAELIALELGDMSLRRWTRCLVSPKVPESHQAALTRIALERLGIWTMDESWHQALLEWIASTGDKSFVPWPTVGAASVAALVVAREQNSCTDRWQLPAHQGLVFVCSGAEAENLLKLLPRRMPGSLRLVFESVAVVAGAESRLIAAASSRWGQVTPSFMYRSGEAMIRQPAAMEPLQVSDLMAALVA